MALEGVFYGTTSNQYVRPKIQWYAQQNVLENYSELTAILTYSRTNTGYKTESTWYGGITVDGVRQSGSLFATVTYESNTEVLRCTQRIYHEDDLPRQVTISADGYFFNTKTSDTVISATVTLDAIPRAARVAATDASIGSVSTVLITGLTQGYSYTLQASFGELCDYVAEDGQLVSQVQYLSAAQIPLTLPESYYAQIPHSPTGVCTLRCVTYCDGAAVGQPQTAQFTVTAAQALCGPELNAWVEDILPATLALTGDASVLILNASTARCGLEATARNAAQILSKTVNGIQVEDSLEVERIASPQVRFCVTDSRGYVSETVLTVPSVAYLPPTCHATAARTDPTGGVVRVSCTGQYSPAQFGQADNTLAVYATGSDGQPVALTVSADEQGVYSAQGELTGFDYELAYTVTVWAEDLVGQSEAKALSVGKGIPVFDWGEADFCFHVPVRFEKGLTQDSALLPYPVGSVYWAAAGIVPDEVLGGTWQQLSTQEEALCAWQRTA